MCVIGSGASCLMLVNCVVPRDGRSLTRLFGRGHALHCSSPLDRDASRNTCSLFSTSDVYPEARELLFRQLKLTMVLPSHFYPC